MEGKLLALIEYKVVQIFAGGVQNTARDQSTVTNWIVSSVFQRSNEVALNT